MREAGCLSIIVLGMTGFAMATDQIGGYTAFLAACAVVAFLNVRRKLERNERRYDEDDDAA